VQATARRRAVGHLDQHPSRGLDERSFFAAFARVVSAAAVAIIDGESFALLWVEMLLTRVSKNSDVRC